MESIVFSVSRPPRSRERFLRAAMIAFAALFLLLGIVFSRALMFPCFCMTLLAFWYSAAIVREWEVEIGEGKLSIDRVNDRGRRRLHEISLSDVEYACEPGDPAVARFRKGGGEKIPKYDYTSYREGVPYYTVIAKENGRRIKLLLDLPPEGLRRLQARTAVPPLT